MAIRSKSKRKKGPQDPSKYPIDVGANYLYWGEQPGYIYDPWNDKYIADPKLQKEYLEKQGALEKAKKQPGMLETAAAAMLPQLATQGGLLAIRNYMTDPKVISELGGGKVLLDNGTVTTLDKLNNPSDAGFLQRNLGGTALGGLIGLEDSDFNAGGGVGDVEYSPGGMGYDTGLSEFNAGGGVGDIEYSPGGMGSDSLTVDAADAGGFWDWLGNTWDNIWI